MKTREQLFNTSNLALAAALAAMGIPFASTPFVSSKSVKGGDQYIFFFNEASACGNYRTGQLMEAWNDESWISKNPDHAFSYIKAAFDNREALLDKVKGSASLVMVEKNGKLAIISANASAELQTKIFSNL